MRRIAILACTAIASFLLTQCDGQAQSTAPKTITIDKSSLVERPERLIVGVGVHFGIGGEYNYIIDKSAALLKELGVDSYRDDLPWGWFAQSNFAKRQYQPSRLFEFMKKAEARPLLILGHSNESVADGNPPLGDGGRAAFADFVKRAAEVTRPFDPIYEIWNEWNMNAVLGQAWLVGPGEKSDPRAATNYAGLAKAAIPALAEVAPNAPVLSGAVGVDQDWLWTRAIVEDGAVAGKSVLSVHLYNHCEADTAKRTATEAIDRVSVLQAMLSKEKGADVPIYVTEFGWPTALQPCVISKQAAADNIAQFLLWSAATPWLKGAWVYQLKDQGRDPNEMEFNFGLYDYDNQPKPAACAVRNAIALIKQSKAFKLERPFPDLFLLQVSAEKGMRVIAWTTSDDVKATLSFQDTTPSSASLLYNGKPAKAGQIAIGAEPVILDFDSEKLSLTVTPDH
jgi:hypothetical protein